MNSLQGIKPGSRGGSGDKAADKLFQQGDTNRSGTLTDKEKRAKETEGRKAESEARRAKTLEVAAESGASERERTAERDARMTAREADAGLTGTLTGRAVGMTADQAKSASAGGKDEEIVKVKDEMVKVNETLNNLAGALSGD